MKYILALTLVFTSVRALCAVGQSVTDIRGHLLKEPLTASLSLEVPDFGIELQSKDGSSTTSFKPNALAYVGVGIDYGNLGFTVSTKVPGSGEDPSKKGSTDNFDLGLKHAWTHDHIEGHYEDYKGFYIGESGNSEGVYQTRPDLTMQHLGVTYFHAFNPEFNVANIDDRRIGKIKKGGSVLAAIAFDETVLNANSALIPLGTTTIYGEEGTLTNGRFITGSAALGYGYVWPWKADLLSFNAHVGAGPQWQWLTVASGDHYRMVAGTSAEGGISYAHQIDSWQLGLRAKYDYNQSDLGSAGLTSYVGSGLAFIQNQF